MNIVIHNPYLGPNIYNLGIHNLINNLIQDGHVSYIFIDTIDKGYTKEIIKKLLFKLGIESFFSYTPSNEQKMPWNFSSIIFSQKILNSLCDVLISFNTHLKEQATFIKHYPKETMYINQKMIDSGSAIEISELHYEKDTVVLGTPSEYLTNAYVLDL